MTGRELIIYILENGLEDEEVIKDGKILGFLTSTEVAEEMDVGLATVYTWMAQGKLPYVRLGGTYYFPADYKSPLSEGGNK